MNFQEQVEQAVLKNKIFIYKMANGIYTFLFILIIIIIILVLFVASSGGSGGGGGGGEVVVSSVSPDYTIVDYGSSTTTPITITGSGFNYGNGALVFLYYPYSTSYFFLSDVVVVNNKTITATIPYIKEAFNAIPYGIQVETYIYEKVGDVGKSTNQKDSNILENAFTFYYTNSPILNSISPNSATIGQGGTTSIKIYGSNFTSMSSSNLEVRFTYPTNISSTAYTSSSATVVDDSTITATVPYNSSSSGLTYGVYLYFGTTPYSNILVDGFTQYAPVTPTITDITPSSGTVNNGSTQTIPVTITGTGFYDDIQIQLVSTYPQLIGNVYETGYATNIKVISSTTLTAEIPYIVSTFNGDTYNITIITGTSGNQLYSNVLTQGFTEYYTGYPVITDISPSSGYEYDIVTVTGYGFSNIESSSYYITFYDVTYPATYYNGINSTIVSDTTATVQVPNLKYTGLSFAVSIGGTKRSNLVYNGFTYEGTSTPTIISISPSSATVDYGETVSLTITGTEFFSQKSPQVIATGIYPSDDYPNYIYPVLTCTDVTVVSSTSITATFPFDFSSSINNGNTFNITLSDSSGSSTLLSGFTEYFLGYPVITSISPTSGTLGDIITITGYNFSNINLSFTYIMDFFDTSTIPWTYYTTSVTILSDTTATVVIPNLTSGTSYILGINASPPSNFYSSFTYN